MELVKNTIRVGNSAGVLLPKEYLNMQVKVVLTPLNVEKDIIEILMNGGLLDNVVGVYIVGSYSRREESIESDVDILVITNNVNKKIKKGKYELLLISEKELERQLEKNIMPLLPMIKEAKAVVNSSLLEKYRNTKITKRNLKWHFDIIKSGLKLNKAAINLDKDMGEKCTRDAVAYSLVLHTRSWYIVDKMLKKKTWSKKEFVKLLNKISGSNSAYEGYVRVKSDNKRKKELLIQEAEKLISYLSKEIKKQESLL
jgi:predicted nucleotidyltransferase